MVGGRQKFGEQPFIGAGAESWKDDMLSRLPGYYQNTAGLKHLKSGSFHNEYVALLAEEGLVCFLPALFIVGLLLRDASRIAFRRRSTYRGRKALFFCALFLVLRGMIELPGLFGYAQDVADYLAYILVAIVISRSLPATVPGMRRVYCTQATRSVPQLNASTVGAQ